MANSDAPAFDTPVINPSWRIAIVRASWHDELTRSLVDGCTERLIALGIPARNITVITVPGSFEVPLFCNQALAELGYDGAVAFGIILQGATHHAQLIAEESARACMEIQLRTTKPVTFEIMYVNTLEDAHVRSVGKKSKGPLAAETLLSCLAKKEELQH